MTQLTYSANNENNPYRYGDRNWRAGNHHYNLGRIYCDPSKVSRGNFYDTTKGLSGCKVWRNANGHNYIPHNTMAVAD